MLLIIVPALFFLLVALILLLSHVVRSKRITDITGSHVLITGGSSGIGKSVAILAVQKGANVTIVARNLAKLELAREEIVQHLVSPEKQRVQLIPVDVSQSYDEVEKAMTAAEDSLGPVDVLVNCAGTSVSGKFEDVPIEDFQRLLSVNFLGSVYVVRAILPGMKTRGKGHIALVSSVAGVMGLYGFTAYSASKFALRGFAESLQMEVKPHNIKVTLSLPPDTDTPGFAEEEKTKPPETKLISQSGGVLSPQIVAKDIMKDALMGNFLSTSGFDGRVVSIVTAGMSPISSLLELFIQVFFMGFLRLVAAVLLYKFDRIVKKCVRTRDQNKKLE